MIEATVDLSRYDHVLIDLDGCVWIGDTPTPRAQDAVSALRAAGKRVAFLTNDPRESPEFYVRKLWRLGFQASGEEVVTVGAALQHTLAEERPEGGSAFVVGTTALIQHVSDAGMRVVNNTDLAARGEVVIVAAHDNLQFAELRVATQAVWRGARLIGVSRDATIPTPNGPWPGSGAVLAAVETAAGRPADQVVGKPEQAMFRLALERLGPGRALVVGDRLDADVEGGRRAGLDAVVVLSGATTQEEADAAGVPAAASLADLIL
jgi:HAD superfamily hydrolase (TIGR01450 family)